MNSTGKIKLVKIDMNDIRTAQIIRAQVQISTDENTQDIEVIGNPGEHSAPMDGDQAYIMHISGNYYVVVAVDDMITPDVEPGEKEIYSRTAQDVKSAIIKLDKKGFINFTNNENSVAEDYAVKYNELKSAFDKLKTDFNNFVTAYNSHTNGPYPLSGPQATQTTADIEEAKSKSVKLV